ncbi:MAG: hypothetical protein WC753_01760 [Candidatus Gracilibacteria bacterium]
MSLSTNPTQSSLEIARQNLCDQVPEVYPNIVQIQYRLDEGGKHICFTVIGSREILEPEQKRIRQDILKRVHTTKCACALDDISFEVEDEDDANIRATVERANQDFQGISVPEAEPLSSRSGCFLVPSFLSWAYDRLTRGPE